MKISRYLFVFLSAVLVVTASCSSVRSSGWRGDVATALEQAEILLMQGDYDSARALFARVEPQDWRASYYGQARALLLDQSDPETAQWYLTEAYGNSSRPEAEVFFWKGLAAFRFGDYLAAESFARDAMERDPENPFSHYLIADIFRAWRNDQYALDEYEQALRFGGDRPELLFLTGWMRLRIGDEEEGQILLEKADRDLSNKNAVNTLMSLHLEDDEALRRLTEWNDPCAMMTRLLSDSAIDPVERTRLLRGLVERGEDPFAMWARAALEGMRSQ